MSDEEIAASLADEGDDNGHAGEDLAVELAMVDTLKGRFRVLLETVRAMRTEMREERKKANGRIFRLEFIVAVGGVLVTIAIGLPKWLASLKEAGLTK